jgi:hypothetical protein
MLGLDVFELLLQFLALFGDGLAVFEGALLEGFSLGETGLQVGLEMNGPLGEGLLALLQVGLLVGQFLDGGLEFLDAGADLFLARGEFGGLLGQFGFASDELLLPRGDGFAIVVGLALGFDELSALRFELFKTFLEANIFGETAGLLLGEAFLAGQQFGSLEIDVVAGRIKGALIVAEASEARLGVGDLALEVVAADFGRLNFSNAGFSGGELGGGLLFTDGEGSDFFSGRGQLGFPLCAFAFEGPEGGFCRRDFGCALGEPAGFVAGFQLKSFDLVAYRGKRFFFVGDFLFFESEIFLALEEFDAIAAHQLHLLCELVLPGGHLFELLLEHLRGVEDGVLRTGPGTGFKGDLEGLIKGDEVGTAAGGTGGRVLRSR